MALGCEGSANLNRRFKPFKVEPTMCGLCVPHVYCLFDACSDWLAVPLSAVLAAGSLASSTDTSPAQCVRLLLSDLDGSDQNAASTALTMTVCRRIDPSNVSYCTRCGWHVVCPSCVYGAAGRRLWEVADSEVGECHKATVGVFYLESPSHE